MKSFIQRIRNTAEITQQELFPHNRPLSAAYVSQMETGFRAMTLVAAKQIVEAFKRHGIRPDLTPETLIAKQVVSFHGNNNELERLIVEVELRMERIAELTDMYYRLNKHDLREE